jgi:hypothetical protein
VDSPAGLGVGRVPPLSPLAPPKPVDSLPWRTPRQKKWKDSNYSPPLISPGNSPIAAASGAATTPTRGSTPTDSPLIESTDAGILDLTVVFQASDRPDNVIYDSTCPVMPFCKTFSYLLVRDLPPINFLHPAILARQSSASKCLKRTLPFVSPMQDTNSEGW